MSKPKNSAVLSEGLALANMHNDIIQMRSQINFLIRYADTMHNSLVKHEALELDECAKKVCSSIRKLINTGRYE